MKLRYPEQTLPFSGGVRVTQFFGSNADYYKQFGFDGHEGLDIVPLDSNWDIHAIEGGVVVRDVDAPRDFNNYGNLVVIWNKNNKRAWWYAHNAENFVRNGEAVSRGQRIARMGSSGNVTGAHVHLGVRAADGSGNAINLDNGYKGFINPLPIMLETAEDTMPVDGNISIPSKTFEELVTKATERDEYAKQFESPAQAQQLIQSLKDDLVAARDAKKEQESRAEEWRRNFNNIVAELATILDTRQDYAEVKANIEALVARIDELEKYKKTHSDDSRSWAETELSLKKEINRLQSLLNNEDVLSNVPLSDLIKELIKRLKRAINAR